MRWTTTRPRFAVTRKKSSSAIVGLTRRGIEPLFPFGHGLSYTDFELSALSVDPSDAGVCVSLDLKNIGDRAGSEVVQIYVGQPDCSAKRPPRELKEFAKVALGSGRVNARAI